MADLLDALQRMDRYEEVLRLAEGPELPLPESKNPFISTRIEIFCRGIGFVKKL